MLKEETSAGLRVRQMKVRKRRKGIPKRIREAYEKEDIREFRAKVEDSQDRKL